MGSRDENWDVMLNLAKELQQEYYELLAEWTIYNENEHSYLKQNIGFAIYGPPTQNSALVVQGASDAPISPVRYILSNFNTSNFTEALLYEPKAQKHIDFLYAKICEHGVQYKSDNSICYGLIYNVTFRNKEEGKDDEDVNIAVTPIFKILRSVSGVDKHNARNNLSNTYEPWFMDISGRIYKSWNDYKTNNKLPKRTMVLPKDGSYQPDPNYAVTEENSIVWLEIQDSPACDPVTDALAKIDTAGNVTGFLGLGIAVASLLTPLGPIALGAGMVAAGANGLWTCGRCTNNLIDRSQHEESISLTDREAFASWLGVSGSVVGVAASGTSFLLSRAVQSGSTIGTTFRMAYNASVACNLGINGIGVGYQAYNMYDKYRTEQTIDPVDVLLLSTHILFFGSAVCNLQFAGEFIDSTQGKVLNDYRSSLRTKRLRKAYNRQKRTAAANNAGNQRAEHAEVIRYINKKQELSNFISNNRWDVKFEQGRLTANGVVLVDPMQFVSLFSRNGCFETDNFEHEPQMQTGDESSGQTATDQFEQLNSLLEQLLTELFSGNDFPRTAHIPTVPDFFSIINEMRYNKNACNILRRMFEILTNLINRKKSFEYYIVEVIRFVWKYLLSITRQYVAYMGRSIRANGIQDLILRICYCILDKLEEMSELLISAISNYLSVVNFQHAR